MMMSFQNESIGHYNANKYYSDYYRHSFQYIPNSAFIFRPKD